MTGNDPSFGDLPRGVKTTKDTVSALKRALLTRDEWLRLAADGAELGLWYWDEVEHRLFTDHKTRAIFGVSLDGDATLETFFQVIHPEDLDHVRVVWRHAVETGQPYQLEYRALRSDGNIRWIDARGSGYRGQAGEPLYMIGIVVDTTERKRADHERLELGGRLIHAQEQERRRLAREIHDDFCQRLAVVTVQMQAMRAMLKDEKATVLLENVLGEVAQLGEDLQALSHQLHSSRFEVLGLVPSIAALCVDMAKQYQLEIDFDNGHAANPLDGEAALSVYRIVQEALHNVVKHSGASQVTIRLEADSDVVYLTVRDDGDGFDSSREYGSAGIGVQSMKERARMLGGTCKIESGPRPHGTRIVVTVPSKPNHRSHHTNPG